MPFRVKFFAKTRSARPKTDQFTNSIMVIDGVPCIVKINSSRTMWLDGDGRWHYADIEYDENGHMVRATER